MFTEYNGRVWSSEENYLKFQNNVRLYMSRSMAIENYSDCTGDTRVDDDEAFKLLYQYRKDKDTMSEQELLDTTALIIQKFNYLLNKIGKEKFTFYDDDTLSFNWL